MRRSQDIVGVPLRDFIRVILRNYYLGVSQIRGTIFGVPIVRIILFWGLYWGPPILGNYHFSDPRTARRAYSKATMRNTTLALGFNLKLKGTILGVPIIGIYPWHFLCWLENFRPLEGVIT